MVWYTCGMVTVSVILSIENSVITPFVHAAPFPPPTYVSYQAVSIVLGDDVVRITEMRDKKLVHPAFVSSSL